MAGRGASCSALTVCLSPTLQKTLVLKALAEDEVNRCVDHRLDASGKGINVTRVMAQLGADVVHVTQLGGSFREKFLQLCNEDALSVSWVESGTDIRFCYTVVNQAKKTSTELVEEAPEVDPAVEALVLQAFEARLSAVRVVVISGSKAKGFSAELFPNMVRIAKSLGKCVVLDYRKEDLLNSLPYRPDVIKPNWAEFVETFFPNEVLGQDPEATRRVQGRMQSLRSEFGCHVIVTRGSKPTLFTTEEGPIRELAPEVIDPVNTIGCGDALTAGVAYALGMGKGMDQAVALGHHCAAQNARNLRPGVIR